MQFVIPLPFLALISLMASFNTKILHSISISKFMLDFLSAASLKFKLGLPWGVKKPVHAEVQE
jgi:hypothetical protein